MKRNLLFPPGVFLLSLAVAMAQSGPPPVPSGAAGAQGAPVSYASVTQLNGLLSQIESSSKNTQTDLGKLRIERWKANGAEKKQTLGNVDSIQRNLQGALPEIIGQLRNAPEDLSVTFKLYRNLDALYDVLNNIAELAGAYGSKDDLQSVSNDISGFEGARKQLAERIESLSSSKEGELTRLRTQLKSLQAQADAAPPKKIVVDDTQPEKKPAPKKKPTTTKKPVDASKPAAGAANPPIQQQAQPKPQ